MKGKLLLSIGLAALALAGGLLIWSVPAARAGGETFVVNSAADDSDNNIGNCQCQTAGGVCTLRAAIQEANACSGGQTIRFSGVLVIKPVTPLPIITDDGTVIDGSDRWESGGGHQWPGVVLDGESRNFSGLVIAADQCAVYGIVINNFGQHGVYIGAGAQNNAIGGTGTHQRNVISGNGQNGVWIEGTATMSNTVIGNYIGTDPTGRYDMGNGWHGVSIWYGAGNEVGDNVIAANVWSGVAVDAVSSGLIYANMIGRNVIGQPLGNGFYGVHIAHGANVQVTKNRIYFNRRGIHVEGGSTPLIDWNDIYGNTASTLSPPNGGGILITGSGTDASVRYNQILSNTAHFGGGIAVESGAFAEITNNTIQANRAYTSTSAWTAGGGIYVTGARAYIMFNDILSNTVSTSGNGYGGGVYLRSSNESSIIWNTIMSNTVSAGDGRGGGIDLQHSNAIVSQNTIRANTAGYSAGGLRLFYSNARVERNLIASNTAPYGGGLQSANSASFTVTNNIIAQNSGGGVRIWATEPSYGLLVNNTIAHNTGAGIYLESASLELDNTIVASNSGYGLYLDDYSLVGWDSAHNDVWGNTNGPSNIDLDYFFMPQDPRFFGAGQYALRAGSPCIDTGRATTYTIDSYNGFRRPQGAGYDIGAYEMPLPTYLPLVLRNY